MPRRRVTIRGLMIAVALYALALASWPTAASRLRRLAAIRYAEATMARMPMRDLNGKPVKVRVVGAEESGPQFWTIRAMLNLPGGEERYEFGVTNEAVTRSRPWWCPP